MGQSKIYHLRPSLQKKIWGGNKLSRVKNSPILNIGESWEVSIHKDGVSLLNDGRPLSDVAHQNEISYLVKLIDTSERLSVQVHPDNHYAQKFENSKGKMECWLVLDTDHDAEIFLGFNDGIDLEDFKKAAQEAADLTPYLKKYHPKPFDFFFVPPGTIHAIGKNILLLEVQQSSGITYRIWDWNRKTGETRPLHLSKAFDVLKFNSGAIFRRMHYQPNTLTTLVSTDDFCMGLILGANELTWDDSHRYKSLVNISKNACSFFLNECEYHLKAYASLTGVWNKFQSRDENLSLAIVT